jgi:glucose-1-phosphate adenylyltransferase
MDLLNINSGLNLDDLNWKIYARNSAEPPQFVMSGAKIKDSLVSEGCVIQGNVSESIISHSCNIGKAEIIGSAVMPGATIMDGAKVYYSIIGENAIIGANAEIGEKLSGPSASGEWEIAVVGPDARIEDGQCIAKNVMIEGGNKNE